MCGGIKLDFWSAMISVSSSYFCTASCDLIFIRFGTRASFRDLPIFSCFVYSESKALGRFGFFPSVFEPDLAFSIQIHFYHEKPAQFITSM